MVLDKDDLNNDRRDLDFENMKKAHADYLKMLQSGNHGRHGLTDTCKNSRNLLVMAHNLWDIVDDTVPTNFVKSEKSRKN